MIPTGSRPDPFTEEREAQLSAVEVRQLTAEAHFGPWGPSRLCQFTEAVCVGPVHWWLESLFLPGRTWGNPAELQRLGVFVTAKTSKRTRNRRAKRGFPHNLDACRKSPGTGDETQK